MTPHAHKKISALRVFIAAITIALITIAASEITDRFILRDGQSDKALDLYASAREFQHGNINGTLIEIRKDFLYFPVHYAGDDAWASSKDNFSNKTYADPIADFSIYVRWPTFEPHKPSNNKSFLLSRSSFIANDWLLISVVNDYLPPPPRQNAESGLSRMLRHRLDALGRDLIRLPHERHPTYHPEIRYRRLGIDPDTGLNHATPTGPGTEENWVRNDDIYWLGDPESIVDTLIICGNGTLPNSTSMHQCEHKFVLNELKAYVTIRYTRNWLSQWKTIQIETMRHLLSMRTRNTNQQ